MAARPRQSVPLYPGLAACQQLSVTDPREEGMVELCQVQDPTEASAIEGLLRERGIRFSLEIRRDTAYPGIVDRLQPFGVLRVSERERFAAQRLLDQWRAAEILEDAEAAPRDRNEPGPAASAGESEPALSPSTGSSWVVLALAAVVVGVAAGISWCLEEPGWLHRGPEESQQSP